MVKIGIAPDSWGIWFVGQPNQVPWRCFLDEVVESGYDAIELGPLGYLPTDAKTLGRELDGRGLRMVGATVLNGHIDDSAHWPAIEDSVLRTGELLATLGADYLVLSELASEHYFGPTFKLDDEGWRQLTETTNKAARVTRDRLGLQFAFHPHCDGHVETQEQIEQLLDQTEPGLVSLCLDTGHHAYAAGDPVAFIRKHHERIIYLHLKDVDEQKLKQVKAQRIPMVQACQMGVFCEQNDGVVDFEALGQVLRDVGFDGWATVEQGLFEPPHDYPLPVAKRTREYLRKSGVG